MALEYYSSIAGANDTADDPLDAAIALNRMLELVSLGSADRSPLFEPGVYRYRSQDEANEARESATIKRMRVMRAARLTGFKG